MEAAMVPLAVDVTDKRLGQFNQLVSETLPPTHLFSKMSPVINIADMWTEAHSRTFLRFRPLLDEEITSNKPSCVALPIMKVSGKRDGIMFNFKMTSSGNPSIESHRVAVDGKIFSSASTANAATKDSNDDVYEGVVPPLLARCVKGNASSAVVIYGSIGSGKTYTTCGITQCLIRDSCKFLDECRIFLTVLEFHYLGIADVLTGNSVQMVEVEEGSKVEGVESNGTTALLGATDYELQTYTTAKKVEEMIFAVRDKNAKAAAKSTMVLRFTMKPKSSDFFGKPGQIFIVDLAGSDSNNAKNQGRMDNRNVLASFSTFRDCVRLRNVSVPTSLSTSAKEELPFRSSPLTLLMHGVFDVNSPFAKVATICCASPYIGQMRAMTETIRFSSVLCVSNDESIKPSMSTVKEDPHAWNTQRVHQFLQASSFNRIQSPEELFPTGEGKLLIEMLGTDENIDKLAELHGIPRRILHSLWSEVQRLVLENPKAAGGPAGAKKPAGAAGGAAPATSSLMSKLKAEGGNKFLKVARLGVVQAKIDESKTEGGEATSALSKVAEPVNGGNFMAVVRDAVALNKVQKRLSNAVEESSDATATSGKDAVKSETSEPPEPQPTPPSSDTKIVAKEGSNSRRISVTQAPTPSTTTATAKTDASSKSKTESDPSPDPLRESSEAKKSDAVEPQPSPPTMPLAREGSSGRLLSQQPSKPPPKVQQKEGSPRATKLAGK